MRSKNGVDKRDQLCSARHGARSKRERGKETLRI